MATVSRPIESVQRYSLTRKESARSACKGAEYAATTTMPEEGLEPPTRGL
jgi:hypothetical protein